MDLPVEPSILLPGKHVSKWSIRLSVMSCTSLLHVVSGPSSFQTWLLMHIPNVLPLCGIGSLKISTKALLPLFCCRVQCVYLTKVGKETKIISS